MFYTENTNNKFESDSFIDDTNLFMKLNYMSKYSIDDVENLN